MWRGVDGLVYPEDGGNKTSDKFTVSIRPHGVTSDKTAVSIIVTVKT